MAIYINKAGTKVDEAVVGSKSASDWQAQGFSVYNPATPPAVKTGSVAIPAGQIANYNVTGQTGVTGAPGSTLYGTPKITADSMTNTNPIALPNPEPVIDNTPAEMAGVKAGQKTLADYIKELTPAETTAQAEQSDLGKKIAELTGQKEGKISDQTALEEQQNIPQLRKDLGGVNAQITTKMAEYDQAFVKMQGEEQARVGSATVSDRRLTQRQSQLQREKASEIGLLQAQSLNLQGQVALAQDAVKLAIDNKYNGIDAQINTYTAQLNALMPTLNREDAIQAQAQLQMANDLKQQQTDKKEEDTKIQNLALTAQTNGADGALVNQISKAKTIYEAMEIAGQLATTTGWKYVATPAERDNLIKQGYEITQSGGRTYARKKELDELGMYTAKKQIDNIYDKKTSSGGTSGGGSTGVSGVVSGQTQAVIDNPSLFDDLTPTNRGKVINELQANGYDTANLGVKGLSDTAITSIAQSQKALDDIDELTSIISQNQSQIGPITGWEALNPWSDKRKIQADINRVRQTVGKALEGGVLRKEDEEKYKKILATITDTPSTALYKLTALKSSIQRDIENYKSLQQSSGRSSDVGASLQKKGATSEIKAEDLRNKYNY